MPAKSASSRLSPDQVSVVEGPPAAVRGDLVPASRSGRIVKKQTSLPVVGADAQAVVRPRNDEAEAHRDESVPAPGDDAEYLRNLILGAFEAAKVGGKEDWQVMSTAVLKNRMTQLLGEKFDQRRYGYPRIVDFVKDFPDLLALDESQNPPLALLLSEPRPVPIDESVQVRSDLWRAVLDYDRREPYLLVDGYAVPSSLAPDHASEAPRLPTITPQDLGAWREDFASSAREILEGRTDQLQRLSDWVAEHQGTRGLPGVLRGRWNLHMKNAVLERLRTWYAAQELELPGDLTTPVSMVRRPELARQHTEESLLRQALLESISRMSFEELRQVSVPAISLIRRRP